MLKTHWEKSPKTAEPQSVVADVVHMREKLSEMTALAQQNVLEAQSNPKTWYDRSARERSFSAEQKVLLSTQDNKLLAKWQGPYEVKQKMGPTTYVIATPGEARSQRTLHVNLLKEWFPRSDKKEVLLIRNVEEEDDEDVQYLPLPAAALSDLKHPTADEQTQVSALCAPEVFKENPGCTNVIDHNIVLKR